MVTFESFVKKIKNNPDFKYYRKPGIFGKNYILSTRPKEYNQIH